MTAQKLKILIVDDEANLREMLTIFFQKLGHRTTVAGFFRGGLRGCRP